MLHLSSDGWSTFYVFDMLRGHPLLQSEVLGFWSPDMLWLAPVFFAAIAGLPPGSSRPGLGFVLWPAGGMLAAAWLGRVHPGGYDNTLLPAGLAAGIIAGRLAGRAVLRHGIGAPGVVGVDHDRDAAGEQLVLGDEVVGRRDADQGLGDAELGAQRAVGVAEREHLLGGFVLRVDDDAVGPRLKLAAGPGECGARAPAGAVSR